MSQRLPIHPTIIDPSTGEPLLALTLIGNMPVWPQMGGQDENEGGSTSEGSESTTQSGEEGTETDTTDDTTETSDTDTSETISKAEYEKIKTRMQAADRRASAAEQKVKDFEKAGQTDLEKAQTERDEAFRERDAERQQLQSLRIHNAFLTANDVNWHDSGDALSMLQSHYMDGVEIDDQGNVSGMKEAIKKMAKEKSYLVNKGTTATSSTKDEMNGKRKGDGNTDQAARDKELQKRMPALSRGSQMT